jgi:GT2 family glycosyltransferase
MTVSIIVPSFRRWHKLSRCLAGIKEQTLTPDQVIVLCAKSDMDAGGKLDGLRGVKITRIAVESISPLPKALNLSLGVAEGDIVVFTDDDTVAEKNWISKIVNTFESDHSIGGVGGRDVIYRFRRLDKARRVKRVGDLTWFGRIVGNHHEILDKRQEVDFLKGCNMSFRREIVSPFDEKLLGMFRWEQDLCFKVSEKGYRIVYDPAIQVKHFKENDSSKIQDLFTISHNTTYILLKNLPPVRRIVFMFYSFAVGQRNNLGFLRTALLLMVSPSLRVIDLLSACLLGKVRGIGTFFKKI